MGRQLSTNVFSARWFVLVFVVIVGLVDSAHAKASGRDDVGPTTPDTLTDQYGQNLVMIAKNKHRDAHEIYAVRSDGAFSYQLFDRAFFDAALNTHEEQAWDSTPIQFVVFDGERTLWTSYPPDPLGVADINKYDNRPPVGDSIHLKACPWPILPAIAETARWENLGEDGYTLHAAKLPLAIHLDQEGRVTGIVQHITNPSGSSSHLTWSFSGYHDSRQSPALPTGLTRSLLVKNRDGEVVVQQTDHFDIDFDQSPAAFARLIGLEDLLGSLNRRDPNTGDVFLPDGELAYNENELLDDYFQAVGLRNPARTRNILFVVVTMLGVGSLFIAWRRRAE